MGPSNINLFVHSTIRALGRAGEKDARSNLGRAGEKDVRPSLVCDKQVTAP